MASRDELVAAVERAQAMLRAAEDALAAHDAMNSAVTSSVPSAVPSSVDAIPAPASIDASIAFYGRATDYIPLVKSCLDETGLNAVSGTETTKTKFGVFLMYASTPRLVGNFQECDFKRCLANSQRTLVVIIRYGSGAQPTMNPLASFPGATTVVELCQTNNVLASTPANTRNLNTLLNFFKA